MVNVLELFLVAMMISLNPLVSTFPSCDHTTVGMGSPSNTHWIMWLLFTGALPLVGNNAVIVGWPVYEVLESTSTCNQ